MFAGVADQMLLDSLHALLLVLREVLMPGYDQGVHVGNTSSWGQDAVALTPANNLPHLEEDIMLHHDEYRCNFIGEHICIGCCSKPLACHGHNVQSLGQLVEEVRVSCFNLIPILGRYSLSSIRHLCYLSAARQSETNCSKGKG